MNDKCSTLYKARATSIHYKTPSHKLLKLTAHRLCSRAMRKNTPQYSAMNRKSTHMFMRAISVFHSSFTFGSPWSIRSRKVGGSVASSRAAIGEVCLHTCCALPCSVEQSRFSNGRSLGLKFLLLSDQAVRIYGCAV